MNNEAAFPHNTVVVDKEGGVIEHHKGMKLRDYFAARSLQKIGFTVRPYDNTNEIAKDCYRMADAMLKAREA